MNLDVGQLATYPTESDDWVITVLIGGLALLFSFFILPMFLVSGYLVRTLRAGMHEADEPPVFDDWGELLREGFVAWAIGIIYQLVPIIVFFVFVGGSLLALLTGSEAGAGFLGILFGVFVSWVLSILFGVVGLAAVANYAREQQFGAGFDFDVILDVVTDRSYLIAWAYVIGLNIVIAAIYSVFNIIPLLGSIIGMFVVFYGVIIAGWIWGQGFAEATGMTPSTEPESSGAPAPGTD